MRTRMILLADNDPIWLSNTKARLRKASYDVRTVSTPEDAVRVLDDPSGSPVDLAIVDLRLRDDRDATDTSGLDVVLKHGRGLRKILATGNHEHQLPFSTIEQLSDEALLGGPRVPAVFKSDAQKLLREVRRAIVPRVFVAHGHDRAAREVAVRFIERAGLIAEVLVDTVDVGRAILERLEAHVDAADFAVVLLTGDDRGAARAAPEAERPRGRQNVIFELGYCIAKLGRTHVAVLRGPDVDGQALEIPSNYLGIDSIVLDDRGAWQRDLQRAMTQAGIDLELYGSPR